MKVKIGIIQKLRKQLFWKISLVFALASVLMVSAAFLAHGLIFMPPRFEHMRRTIVNHITACHV